MFLGIAAIALVLIIWFCFSAGLVLLGIAGLIAYFITRHVFRRKGKAKPKAVWFILPTIVLILGVISSLVMLALYLVATVG